jgi:hypothetical protein
MLWKYLSPALSYDFSVLVSDMVTDGLVGGDMW